MATELERILMHDRSWWFLGEVVLRTLCVYAFTLLVLRWMGKRGMGQLTPFEFAIIVALGSAVGDPMFYDDVPVLPSLLAIATVIGLQRLLAKLTEKNEAIERFVESSATLLVENGVIRHKDLHAELLSREELFEGLRQEGIHQLGQLALVYLEPSGRLSVIRLPREKPGLTVLPEGKIFGAQAKGLRCCACCGQLARDEEQTCAACGQLDWTTAVQPDSVRTHQ